MVKKKALEKLLEREKARKEREGRNERWGKGNVFWGGLEKQKNCEKIGKY